mmetsp:Transcript_2735/g.8302  ORF Transcript_2735/g.8302 Transcript_2735/m.8302 type:complete len:214 (-) Transcript_2735:708-1349(-)
MNPFKVAYSPVQLNHFVLCQKGHLFALTDHASGSVTATTAEDEYDCGKHVPALERPHKEAVARNILLTGSHVHGFEHLSFLQTILEHVVQLLGYFLHAGSPCPSPRLFPLSLVLIPISSNATMFHSQCSRLQYLRSAYLGIYCGSPTGRSLWTHQRVYARPVAKQKIQRNWPKRRHNQFGRAVYILEPVPDVVYVAHRGRECHEQSVTGANDD